MRDYSGFAGQFPHTLHIIERELLAAPVVSVGEWHAQDVSTSRDHDTHELLDVTVALAVPYRVEKLQKRVKPNLPWAEDHFKERISGRPVNPPPSHEYWPFGNTHTHLGKQEKFSHTYPERFWPRYAGGRLATHADGKVNRGIRFNYGDLDDVVGLLVRNRNTRQAYLPIWFPEDLTAAIDNQRVPCSLGYHFLVRNGIMSVRYHMRACEFVRHFQDDLYMAARLLQHVCSSVNLISNNEYPHKDNIQTGQVIMTITSLHMLVGDARKIREER